MFQIVLSLALLGAGEDDPAGIRFFEKEIRPILVQNCYQCHSARANRVRGGLLLDTKNGWMNGGDSGPVIVPGNPGESLLLKAISYQDDDLQMPPKRKLPEAKIRAITAWIKRGAPDPRVTTMAKLEPSKINIEEGKKFWAFQQPTDHPAPAVKDESWPRSDVDRFILKELESRGLQPTGDADRRDLIRRVSFDLTGLPPTPREVEEFLADDSPEAFEKVVDRLLSSKRFGERWGRHWLDVARYAESTGKTRNYPFSHAWRYRDYVIQAFNEDKPYDRFVREQIAGDLLPAEDPDEINQLRVATGFLALGPKDLNERNRQQFIMDNVDEQLDTMSRSILGITVGCARCHDHKFDPIPTTDYYAMAGIFTSTEILAGLSNRQYQTEMLYPVEGGEQPKKAEPEPTRTSRYSQKLIQDGRSKRAEIARLKRAPGDNRAKIRRLEGEYQRIASQLRRQKNANNRRGSAAPDVSMIMGVRDGQRAADCRVCIKGEVTNQGATVPRGFLQVIGLPSNPDIPAGSSGRLELAGWLSDPDNPLTARVMANRIWHHLFGHGLVRTVDNFGFSGERPSHLELLDHLAQLFVSGDWSVKKFIRAMVLTRTYQLSSDHDEANYAVDPDNVYRWRMSQRRLDVEAFRDAMLATSGQIDFTMPHGSEVMKLAVNEVGRTANASSFKEANSNNRSVYLPILRSMVPDMFEAFDFAEPSLMKGRRDVTTVATQALYLMNSEFVRTQAGHMARRVLERDLGDTERVRLAYQIAFGRPPTSREEERSVSFVHREVEEARATSASAGDLGAWSGFCQALYASAEFRYVN